VPCVAARQSRSSYESPVNDLDPGIGQPTRQQELAALATQPTSI
jgi:hypothetical protein